MATKSKSIQDAQALLEKLRSNTGLVGKIDATRSYAEFLGVARQEGFDLSGLTEAEALGVVRGDASALGEISEDDLARVSGGAKALDPDDPIQRPMPPIIIGGW